jgi:hypothetical protein
VYTRFRKGQSGNLRGRPKKRPEKKLGNPHQKLIELLGQTVTLKVGDKAVKMTKHEALIQKLWSAAMSGDKGSLIQLVKMVNELPPHLLADVEAFRHNSESEKLIELFLKKAEEYQSGTVAPPEQD